MVGHGTYLDERDAVLHAESGDKLLVHGLVTVLAEDAEQRLPLVQGLHVRIGGIYNVLSNLKCKLVSLKGH